MVYGAFLILAGVAGYLSNPEKARTALMSGGTFGALSLFWGWRIHRGHRWAVWTALFTTGFLALIFGWRAAAGWQQYAAGNPDKLVAAVLISLMLAASVLLLPRIVIGLRRHPADGQLPRP